MQQVYGELEECEHRDIPRVGRTVYYFALAAELEGIYVRPPETQMRLVVWISGFVGWLLWYLRQSDVVV